MVRNAELFASPPEQERLIKSTNLPVVASVRDPEASRPRNQFLFQVSEERQWIEDELCWTSRDGIGGVDLDAMSYKSVRDMWVKDGLWITEWIFVPGMTWAHEEPDEALETDPCYRRLYHSYSGKDANALHGPDANTSNHARSESEVLNAAGQRSATERFLEPQNQPLHSGPSSLPSYRDPLEEASHVKPSLVDFCAVKSVSQGKTHQDQSTINTDVLDASTSLSLPAAHSRKRKRDSGLRDGPGQGNDPKHLRRVAGEISPDSNRCHDLRSHSNKPSRTHRDQTAPHLTDSSLQTTTTAVRRSQRLQNKARLKHQGNTSSGSRDAQQVSQPSHDLRSNRFRTSRNAEIVEEGAASRSRLDRRTVSRSQRKK